MGCYDVLKYQYGKANILASLRCDGYSKIAIYQSLEADTWIYALKWPKNAIFDGQLHKKMGRYGILKYHYGITYDYVGKSQVQNFFTGHWRPRSEN